MLFGFSFVYGQESQRTFDQTGAINLLFGYGIESPVGEMADRFGNDLNFSLAGERMSPSGWLYGVKFSFLFGSKVKEDVLAPLRLSNGEILGADNAYADVFLRQRGMYLGAYFGRTIPLNHTKSGLRITNAFGVFQHNIRIVDDARSLPQIEGDYQKGYDRLTRGFALRQFVGYHHIGQDRRLNFIVGIELTEGFTKHIRSIDFDTGLPVDHSMRFDGLIGLKAAYIFPFFDDYQADEIFY